MEVGHPTQSVLDDGDVLSGSGFYDINTGTSPADRNQSAIRRVGNRLEGAMVWLHFPKHAPRNSVPKVNMPVNATGNHCATIWRKGHSTHVMGMPPPNRPQA